MLPISDFCLAAGLPGGWELWIILFIILVLFGTRLPKVARSLGQGINEFKKGINEPIEPDEPENPPAGAVKPGAETTSKMPEKATPEKAEETKDS